MSNDFNERPIIITDFETTGLDPQVHEVVDIGAIKVNHDLDELGRYDVKIIPQHLNLAQPAALAINGYNEADWRSAVHPFEAFSNYVMFAAGGILCAWNITFEYTFFDENIRNLRIPNALDYHRIDIPSIVWVLGYGRKSMSMDAVAAEFGLLPEQKPHTGIRGAERELELLRLLHRNAVAGRTEY